MGQDNEEAGQDTQKIHPETMWLPREFNDWLVFMLRGKNSAASSQTFLIIYPFPGNVLSLNGEKKQKAPNPSPGNRGKLFGKACASCRLPRLFLHKDHGTFSRPTGIVHREAW